MGRSRAVFHSTEEDPNQRSKRKRTASSVETTGPTPSVHGLFEGKGALYHCNYCNKDISGRIRIKCIMCPDFDLCVECFSVGAEVTPHKSNHPYRVMDNLSFPLMCPDWNADEEILLLEGIEMYGFGNWAEVAEHVGTKSKTQCIDHYNAIYMSSPCFPLPDMSHVMGKSRSELLAMSRGPSEVEKEIPHTGELTLKEETPLSARVSFDESQKGPAWHSSSSLTSDCSSSHHDPLPLPMRYFLLCLAPWHLSAPVHIMTLSLSVHKYKDPSLLASERGTGLVSSSDNTSSGVVKKVSSQAQIKDDTSMEGMLSAFYYEYICCPPLRGWGRPLLITLVGLIARLRRSSPALCCGREATPMVGDPTIRWSSSPLYRWEELKTARWRGGDLLPSMDGGELRPRLGGYNCPRGLVVAAGAMTIAEWWLLVRGGDIYGLACKNKFFRTTALKKTKCYLRTADRSVGEKKPRVVGDEGLSVTELSGYNFKRQEFEIEYDNDAELVLADMEFKATDSNAERELKLRVLHIYSKRLDERKRRKDFILERNLLYPDPYEKSLSPEEREICQRFKVFMRFQPKEVHEEFLKNIIEEQRIVKRIQDLQEARAAGCRTAAEVDRFLEQNRKKEVEGSEQGVNESAQGPSSNMLQRQIHDKVEFDASPQGAKGSTGLHPSGKDSSSAMQATSSFVEEWDITGFAGVDLLSETEKRLCGEIRILPSHYLNMLQIMSVEILKGNVTKKSDAHSLFKVESSKVDTVYDMLVKKGIAQA
ncbi:Transcriptional adapter ADA2 [Morella rubra]|uniref:Transcriptional adapter ADA2 n=1 Tax=Morella rubra TaxID=262757 RepID=A0A6A1WB93_9ROSI|nr:Transcriptional adapter ADA2 [Morella rubra]